MAAFYFQVYNSAMKTQVSFEKENFASFEDAKKYRDELRADYGNIGCHEVKMFLEIYPDEEGEDIEEEFDIDELEEEE